MNPVQCDETKALGWYQGMGPVMVICQENREVAGEQVEWTEEDYDTLRHEAQHLIQDCKDGRIDHKLQPFIEETIEWSEGILGIDVLREIYQQYSAAGAPDEVILLEFEAFATAAMNRPDYQAKAVATFCGVK